MQVEKLVKSGSLPSTAILKKCSYHHNAMYCSKHDDIHHSADGQAYWFHRCSSAHMCYWERFVKPSVCSVDQEAANERSVDNERSFISKHFFSLIFIGISQNPTTYQQGKHRVLRVPNMQVGKFAKTSSVQCRPGSSQRKVCR